MAEAVAKVGVISCSGEEIPEGTVSRLAVRRVLEALRPRETVTLCLPLFLAGEEGERRFAGEHPTITVDGCPKLCARRGVEKFSGKVSVSLVVSEILGDRAAGCHRSIRQSTPSDEQAVWLVAERIAAEVDALWGTTASVEADPASSTAQPACCSCGGSPEGSTLRIKDRSVTVSGLTLIFDHLRKKGLSPDEHCGDNVLKTVQIYHPIGSAEEADYRTALAAAYRAHCQKGS
jgi:hypothetical protein